MNGVSVRGRLPSLRVARRACLAAALASLAALVACNSAPPTPPAPVTISLAPPASPGERTEYYFLIESFQEDHSHVTVELLDSALGADVYQAQSFGHVPRVSYVPGSDEYQAPTALRLDPLIAEDQSIDSGDYYPGAVEALAYQGETYALPAGLDVLVLYYNQDLFDRYGVPYPGPGWTWEDFLSRARALRNPAAGVYGYIGQGSVIREGEALVAVPFPAIDAAQFPEVLERQRLLECLAFLPVCFRAVGQLPQRLVAEV